MNWLRFKLIYFLISLTLLGVGIFSLVKWGLKLGVDFRGGAIIEYRIEEEISTEAITAKLEEENLEVGSIQTTGEKTYLFRFPPISQEEREKIDAVLIGEIDAEVTQLRFENVGPSVGPELVKKTVYALIISAGAILLWIAIQFKSFKFGVSAILAMFHDSFILLGSFAFLGHLLGVEVDFLFVTALLTTLSFSVHDTIVVYDRIRETQKRFAGDFTQIANRAISETMVRSLNNSFTIIFMLVALILLGGITIRWFAAALLIGTILGTYSSPFVAVPLLATWDKVAEKLKRS